MVHRLQGWHQPLQGAAADAPPKLGHDDKHHLERNQGGGKDAVSCPEAADNRIQGRAAGEGLERPASGCTAALHADSSSDQGKTAQDCLCALWGQGEDRSLRVR